MPHLSSRKGNYAYAGGNANIEIVGKKRDREGSEVVGALAYWWGSIVVVVGREDDQAAV
jgi:hypothetical protein